MSDEKIDNCPHPQCTVMKPRAKFACQKHWFELPKEIRDGILTTYRKKQWREWLKWNDKAIAHYWGKE